MSIVANSGFSTSLVGALFGAWGGAWAAQRIASQEKGRDLLLTEIRETNNAIMNAFTICNSLIAFKEQHAKPLYEKYNAQKMQYDDVLANPFYVGPFHISGDFRLIRPPIILTAGLANAIDNKISTLGRPQALMHALLQQQDNILAMLELRNVIISEMKSLENPGDRLAEIYFGVPSSLTKSTDTRHHDSIIYLYESVDNALFFTEALLNDLVDHGNECVAEYRGRFKETPSKIATPNFKEAYDKNLMPAPAEHREWVKKIKRSGRPPYQSFFSKNVKRVRDWYSELAQRDI
ncbi:hypothetical protein [Amantichitinum ursilacus]|uniref:hypothetical protein n=1 Tax=Amantichitinum ursilacus TaxID=857265 RepID=UPI00128F119F|nr:hypothetical protein [Amantichitinum ursilacus]